MSSLVNYGKEIIYRKYKPTKEKCIRIINRDIEKVNQFKYLGTNITNNNNISSAINHKINKGKK